MIRQFTGRTITLLRKLIIEKSYKNIRLYKFKRINEGKKSTTISRYFG